VLVSVWAVLAITAPHAHGQPRRVMPWMCLERCGFNTTQIVEQLKQLNEHRNVITAVAFEMFNLGPNSTLITNELFNPLPAIKSMGFDSYAMVR
jgi:hypothetical protein